jgi:thioredoxin 1
MTSKNVLPIDDATFDREVLGSPVPFLLDFGGAWCAACKALMPTLERIADENVGALRVGRIDVDESPEVTRRLGIRGTPTIVAFKHGKEVARQLGTTSRARLLAMVQES